MSDWDHLNKWNRSKSEFLGINVHKANKRMQRQLLFHLAGRLNMLGCFKCSLPIATYEEMSIEHKVPWLNNDAALFWNMENIAFSHKRCNRPHVYRGSNGIKRMVPIDPATAWCTGHQDFLPVQQFDRNTARWNGLQNVCKLCMHRHYLARTASSVKVRKQSKGRRLCRKETP